MKIMITTAAERGCGSLAAELRRTGRGGVVFGSFAVGLRRTGRGGFVHVGEEVGDVFAGLLFGVFEMNGALVDADGGAGLHAVAADAEGVETLSEMERGGFGAAASGHHLTADVHEAVEESAGGDDDGGGDELAAPDGADAPEGRFA